jgi:hypothetical protein
VRVRARVKIQVYAVGGNISYESTAGAESVDGSFTGRIRPDLAADVAVVARWTRRAT